jgi:RNA polymerase sigma-70 factor (ECF subfamily)
MASPPLVATERVVFGSELSSSEVKKESGELSPCLARYAHLGALTLGFAGHWTMPNADAAASTVCYPRAVAGRSAPSLPRAALDHLDALYRVARRLTGREDDAEDLVQETYTRALAGHSSFTADTNLRAWLFRILRNAHIDSYRRAQANPVRPSTGDDPDTADSSAAREPLRGDAELERLRGAVAADIEAALASLTVDARTIILLDLEGFSGEELAEILGCPVGTIKSRLSRARENLRERLRDYRD